MGARINGGGARRRMVSEINVTPFVDVMLVLLIIFMVAAPMMIQGIDVKLPAASAKAMSTETEKLAVTVSEDGKVFVNDSAVEIEALGSTLAAVYRTCGDGRGVILRADRKVEYGFVVQIMDAIREAGIDQIGMVTRALPEGKGQPGR